MLAGVRAIAAARCRCAVWRHGAAALSTGPAPEAAPPRASGPAGPLRRHEQTKQMKVNFGRRRREAGISRTIDELMAGFEDEGGDAGTAPKMSMDEMRAQIGKWAEEADEFIAADIEQDEREFERREALRSGERARGPQAPEATPPLHRQRLLEISILGSPNAGKSTLLNTLVGTKVSIVASKAQTTREQVLGVRVDGNVQAVFYDTPGIVRPETQRNLARPLTKSPWESLWESDVALLVVDASRHLDAGVKHAVQRMAKEAAERRAAEAERRALLGEDEEGGEEEEEDEEEEEERRPDFRVALVLNKVDQLRDKTKLLDLALELHALAEQAAGPGTAASGAFFEETFMISAHNGDGAYINSKAPRRAWLFPLGTTTDLGPEDQVRELLREKLLRFFNKEIPYIVEQETVHWEEPQGPKGPLLIKQAFHVARDSQRELLYGKGGGTMKRLRERAEADIGKALGRPVQLELTVKIRDLARRSR
eukprot:tig00020878_g14876.t1